jgi:pimeloyl-ACP methyl ester carboxylesterase
LRLATPRATQVTHDVHAVIRRLQTRYRPRAVIVMGHSGGAGVAANLLGRYPEDADAAVLIACSCDPKGFMDRWKREHPFIPKDLPNPSLSPLDMAAGVSRKTLVRMVVGSNDAVVLAPPSQAYAAALRRNGVDVRLAVVNGADHVNVLGTDAVHQAVAEVIAAEGGKVRAPGG